MLILALGAVVVGCVFLVVSFLTENVAWAWGCIGACGLAAVVLVVDTIRRGRAPRHVVDNPAEPPNGDIVAEPGRDEAGTDRPISEESATAVTAVTVTSDTEATQVLPAAAPRPEEPRGAVGESAVRNTPVAETDGREPDEEDVDAADALVVGGLPTEVVVVDEHPRFHLVACRWLGDRRTLTLPVTEAIELGFTGCARCQPSATLAARFRQR